jgi:hypothetical protein
VDVPIGYEQLGVLFILAAIFLGPKALPAITGRRGTSLRDTGGHRHAEGRWRASDWVLVIAVIGLGLLAAALAASVR